MPLRTMVNSVVQFLRAGYPEGVPPQDYFPLLALLRRRASDEEIEQIVRELVAAEDTDSLAAMNEAIVRTTNQSPSEQDLARVSARLAAGGWPLAALHAEE